MKKIAIMALAIVLALGTLGVGYALWFQTVNISGTVETGYVNISACNPTGTLVYKDLVTDELIKVPGTLDVVPDLPAAGPVIGDHDTLLVAVAQTTGLADCVECDTPNGSLTVNVAYYNLFPIFDATGEPDYFCADFDLTNTGTIPVKALVLDDFTPSGIDGLSFHVDALDEQGAPITLEGYQLEPDDFVHILICIDVPDDPAYQNLDGSFTATIVFEQWNEYRTLP
jgi:hypothetical protein